MRASTRAVSLPSPLVAPVMSTTVPANLPSPMGTA